MEYLSDIFLGGAAIAAAIYCLVLSRKLSRLKGLDQDLGGAIAILSKQVDDMTTALSEAQQAANSSSQELSEIAARADTASEKLEMLVASLHDLPDLQPQKEKHSDASEPVNAAPDQPLFVRHLKLNGGGAM